MKHKFLTCLTNAEATLSSIDPKRWAEPYAPGSWLCKEVLGHLVDSAINNHIRFVMAALNGHYEGPEYEQTGWVRLHDYAHVSWEKTLEQWRCQNDLLRRVVSGLTEEQLQSPCKIGSDAAVPLRDVIDGYLSHMGHHVEQIQDKTKS